MFILLSPAKKLRVPEPLPSVLTQPALVDQAEVLSGTTAALDHGEIKRLMKLSDKLAQLNHERFQALAFPHDSHNATPAALTFDGDVYRGLDAPSLSDADLEWAQDRLGILSGLYGLLRPLDLIQPYRLEMGTSLGNARGKTLYAFWGDRIATEINRRANAHDTPCILNLASNEYFKAARSRLIEAPIVTPVFKEIRDGKAKIISFYAKKARGLMARFAVDNRVTDPQDLKKFDREGYHFAPDMSDDSTWLFTRSS
jgi:cytoplasmic iron level regulating protein YaaA (DUF328/UPF0246 family)